MTDEYDPKDKFASPEGEDTIIPAAQAEAWLAQHRASKAIKRAQAQSQKGDPPSAPKPITPED